MALELEIGGVPVASRKWSGPGTLRRGYRGVEPGSREAGNCNFTLFDTKILKPVNSLALSFDGVDDYVEVPDNPLLRFPAIMTVAFWLRRKSNPSGSVKTILSKGGNGEYGAFQVASGIFGGGLDARVRFRQSTDGIEWQTIVTANSGSYEWTAGQWNCYVCVNDGSGARIYLNNVASAGDSSPATGELWVNDSPLTLGCGSKPSDGVRGNFGDLEIDELVIVPYAWTVDEIAVYYAAGRGTRQFQGERLRWHLDDGGSTARDSVSGLVGQVNGALWIPSAYAMPEDEDVLERGKEVVIRRNGKLRYRGIITGVDKGKRDTEIETKEDSARMNDLEAGMVQVGGLSNPDLYLYHMEQGRSADGEVRSILAFEVRTEQSFGGLPEPHLGYEKSYIFDSFEYTRGAAANAPDRRLRGMLWREDSPQQIVARIAELAVLQEGPRIQTSALESFGPNAQISLRVRTEAGEAVILEYQPYTEGDQVYAAYGPWGMVTRTIAGRTYTFLWIMREVRREGLREFGGTLEFYQLLNHGLAAPIGKIDCERATDTFALEGGEVRLSDMWWGFHTVGSQQSPHERYFGPWIVPEAPNEPHLLSFFWIGGKVRNGEYLQRAVIFEVDLRQIRCSGGDGPFPYRRLWMGGSFENGWQKWIRRSGGFYTFTSEAAPLRETISRRLGGRYENTGAGPNIFWAGDLWLSEAAYDFRDAKLRDVLGELCACLGCEWWIEEGTLRIEALNRSRRIVDVSAARILKDRRRESADLEKYSDFSPSGIPVTEETRTYLAARLGEVCKAAQSHVTRRIELLPRGEPEYSLGAKTTVNGELAGRLTAVEHGPYVDTLELQPVSEMKIQKPAKKRGRKFET